VLTFTDAPKVLGTPDSALGVLRAGQSISFQEHRAVKIREVA
jgi:hypothetical protein